MTDEELLALGTEREREIFSELERAVIDYAVALSSTPVVVDAALTDRLRSQLDERQLVELTAQITYGNHLARFSRAFDLPASGRSAGHACPMPDVPVPQDARSEPT